MSPSEPQRLDTTSPSRRSPLVLTALAAIVALGVFAFIAAQRPGQDALWGDEGTYVAMTASLARDGDLRFERSDRDWAGGRVPGRGATVILQRTEGGITYSKPPLYPLVAAPFFKLFGEAGLIVVNVLALAIGLFFAWLCLARIGSRADAGLTVVTFAAAGVLIPYLAWRMSESLQVGLMLSGLALVCGALRPATAERAPRWQRFLDHPLAPFVGGLLAGLLVSMRLTNAALVGGMLLALVLSRRWQGLLLAAAGTAAGLAALLLLSQLLLGTASPYTAERTSFNAELGYPLDDGTATGRFDDKPATHRLGLRANDVTLYSAFYFVFGRHTGLLAYFPLALLAIAIIVRSRDRTALALATGALALALFYLLYTPHNYFGGSTFLGNRYFLVAYPALLIALPRLPSIRALTAVLTIGLAFGSSAMVSARAARTLHPTSQSHASAGLFRWLPYESTAVGIQGHEDRFWSRDYVRFVDPWADVRRGHLVLSAERRSAELMITSHRPRETMYFLARPHQGAVRLLWTDWRSDGEVDLEVAPGSAPLELTIEPSSPWRSHSFWFGDGSTYEVRLVRLGVDGPPASTIELYYLGGGERLRQGFRWTLLSAEVPDHASASGTGVARVRVRNDSRTPWKRRDVMPVTIGYRLEAPDGLADQDRRLLPSDIGPGEVLDVDIEIRWPAEPGEYRLVIDLWLHPVRWFADIVGRPVFETPILVD
jgi:4-amino-4-deoxy-L-arabinose transferase-like glycosyltransferase